MSMNHLRIFSPFKWKFLPLFRTMSLLISLLTPPLPLMGQDDQASILKLYSSQDLTEEFVFSTLKGPNNGILVKAANLQSCGNKCTVKYVLEGKINLKEGAIIEVGPKGKSPASNSCRALLGLPLTFYKSNLAEIEVCLFRGGDMILSWDLHSVLKQGT